MERHVLVTGASRGIGRAVAVALAEAGFSLALNYRGNHEAAEATQAAVQAIGGRARLLPFDVADRVTARQKIEADMETHGVYWGVVCNAGVIADGPFPAMSGEKWDLLMRTNMDGFYNVLHPITMPMIQAKKGGRIVTMSSVSGLIGNRGQAAYSATKAGIIAATKSLAKELAKRKITVNSVAPGLIETDMVQDVEKDLVLKAIPMRRFGKPEEVAGLVRYLFSDSAAYLTGQVISVNGGLV